MKGRMLCLYIVTALFATAANAQTLGSRLAADVPFEFMAGNSKLPAGQYEIETPLPNVVRFSSPDRSVSAMLITNAAARTSADSVGKLVFRKYGDQHFLESVWSPGAASGVQLRPSAAELETIARVKQSARREIAATRR